MAATRLLVPQVLLQPTCRHTPKLHMACALLFILLILSIFRYPAIIYQTLAFVQITGKVMPCTLTGRTAGQLCIYL